MDLMSEETEKKKEEKPCYTCNIHCKEKCVRKVNEKTSQG